MELLPHQKEAVENLANGKILYGGVGTGKSHTAIAYYVKAESDKDIYVITTAKKRDSLDWERVCAQFGIGTERSGTVHGTLKVDSWNNIGKYCDVEDAFFIFDEQRLVGSGVWVKSFLKIAKKNRWIMLTATPGDTMMDYAPVFIANGLYRNITQFKLEHVVYAPFSKYPKIVRYLNMSTLEKYRNMLLVEMPYMKHTNRIVQNVTVDHDRVLFEQAFKKRWNVFENRPIVDIAELFRVMRKIVNSDPSRMETIRELMQKHPRLIIFYNFDYELEILRTLVGEIEVGEWNGHRKNPVPNSDRWVYLVQYVSGAEAWNCVATNAMIFYSLTYSYKNFIQAQGRIDRLDTPFTDLFYYVLMSDSIIDRAIWSNLARKKMFNERVFAQSLYGKDLVGGYS